MLIHKTGKVKWFEFGRGFGFVTPDDGGGDIFIHINDLRAAGIEQINTGDTIECTANRSAKGWQAKSIVSWRADDLVAPSANGSNWEPGKVKWFCRQRGFGFVTPQRGRDAFIHAETARSAGMITLDAQQDVLIQTSKNERGPIVTAIRPANMSTQP